MSEKFPQHNFEKEAVQEFKVRWLQDMVQAAQEIFDIHGESLEYGFFMEKFLTSMDSPNLHPRFSEIIELKHHITYEDAKKHFKEMEEQYDMQHIYFMNQKYEEGIYAKFQLGLLSFLEKESLTKAHLDSLDALKNKSWDEDFKKRSEGIISDLRGVLQELELYGETTDEKSSIPKHEEIILQGYGEMIAHESGHNENFDSE